MKKEKIIFIINSTAGKKFNNNVTSLITKHLDQKKYIPFFVYTNYPGHATEIAQHYYAKGVKKFIAVGGDGTVNETGKALIGTKGIMGILPLGSGNGLARHLKIPLNLKKAIHLINNHKVIKIDYGKINDIPFFCTCGVGFDASIGKKFSKAGKRGFKTYIKTTISSFYNYKPKKYRLEYDNKKIKTKAFMVTFANITQYGNNAYIAPQAKACDGMLDISILRPFPRHRVFGLGTKLFTKKIHTSKYMETTKTKAVQLKRKRKGPVNIDGEPYKLGKKLKIKAIKHGLNVMAPANKNY